MNTLTRNAACLPLPAINILAYSTGLLASPLLLLPPSVFSDPKRSSLLTVPRFPFILSQFVSIHLSPCHFTSSLLVSSSPPPALSLACVCPQAAVSSAGLKEAPGCSEAPCHAPLIPALLFISGPRPSPQAWRCRQLGPGNQGKAQATGVGDDFWSIVVWLDLVWLSCLSLFS